MITYVLPTTKLAFAMALMSSLKKKAKNFLDESQMEKYEKTLFTICDYLERNKKKKQIELELDEVEDEVFKWFIADTSKKMPTRTAKKTLLELNNIINKV